MNWNRFNIKMGEVYDFKSFSAFRGWFIDFVSSTGLSGTVPVGVVQFPRKE
jgi:hypothetical protein